MQNINGKSERKRPSGRAGSRLKNNIKWIFAMWIETIWLRTVFDGGLLLSRQCACEFHK